MSNKGHQIGCYIRVSTEEQASNPEGSIKNQIERIKSLVKLKNDGSHFGEIREFYIDRAKSGKDTKRIELQRMLKDIREGTINFVVVTELSRISRSIKDFAEIWELFQKHSCGFLSLREAFDTTTAAGEMLIYNMANLAQFERRQVVERVTANLEARAARGLYNGGPVPVGYVVGKEKGYLEVNKEHAKLVRSAFKIYLQEESLSLAAKKLNSMGVNIPRTMQGGGSKVRLGHFTVDNLHRLLRNKAYVGIRLYRSKKEVKEVKAVWPAIIDQLTFERVQKKLTKSFCRKKPMNIKNRYPYILSGKTFCLKCQEHLSGKSAHGCTQKIPYYEHGWATKRQACLVKPVFQCLPTRVPGRVLESAVWEKIEGLLSDPNLAQDLVSEAKEIHCKALKSNEFEIQSQRIKVIDSKIEALAERLSQIPKTVSATPIFKQMEKLEALKKDEQERLAHMPNQVQKIDLPMELSSYQEFLKGVKKLKNLTPETRQKVVEQLIHKIEVKPDGFVVHYYVGRNQIRKEPEKSGSSFQIQLNRSQKFFVLPSSNSLTIGDRGKD
jgi:site-specific DNA recombinase